MSHTNSTANYNLPQFITTDKPAWLTDVNNAYSAIDLGIKAAKDAGDNAQGDATQALTDAGNAQTTANSAQSAATGAVASISENFIDSATYNVGDLVMYNNLLYKCHTAVTVPGPWTGSVNWSRTDIDTELSSIYGNEIAMSDTDPDTVSSRIINLENRYNVKYHTTPNLILSNLSWVQTAAGMYRATYVCSDIPVGSKILGITIFSFAAIRSTDVFMPYINLDTDREIGIMSNKNSFESGSYLVFRVIYI